MIRPWARAYPLPAMRSLPPVLLLAIALLLPGAASLRPPRSGEDRPRILVANDDGIDSPGLHALVEALAPLGEVVVCAPDGNRSGASHSSQALGGPMEVRERSIPGAVQALAVDGSPADAVLFGLLQLGGERGFDVVVSGINHGANVGDVAHYSGTVGAAMEAGYRGIPAVAVSQSGRRRDHELAARFTAAFVARLLAEEDAPRGVVWSINVPAVEVQGVVAVPMGGSFVHVDGFAREAPGEGLAGRWRARVSFPREAPPGSDTAAWLAGQVTVTPLRCDWTDAEALADLREWLPALPATPAAR